MQARQPLERRSRLIAQALAWKGPQGTVAKAPVRRLVDITDLVRWAYREELPKLGRVPAGPAAPRGAWDKVERWLEEMSLAGLDDNRFGVVPDITAGGLPHPDALEVHAAMERLDSFELDLPDGWNPIADLDDLRAPAGPDGAGGDLGARAIARGLQQVYAPGAERRRRAVAVLRGMTDDARKHNADDVMGARVLRDDECAPLPARFAVTPRQLVFRHAILGDAPMWQCYDKPVVEPVKASNGKARWFAREVIGTGAEAYEIEVDGLDARRQPKAHAFRKYQIVPDIVDLIIDRAHFELWRAALEILSEDLCGRLESRDVQMTVLPPRPWDLQDDAVRPHSP